MGRTCPDGGLERASIGATLGTAGGKGRRSVASYDEDTTTMGTEAARLALRSAPGASPSTLWFSTTSPAYVDKTNATTIHAALRLDPHVLAADAGGAARSAVAVLRATLEGPTLRSWWRRTSGVVSPADRTKQPEATAPRRSSSAPTTTVPSWPNISVRPARARSSSTAGAPAGRHRIQGLGGAFRRGTLRRARPARVEGRPQGGRDRRRGGHGPDRGEPARPGRARAARGDWRARRQGWCPRSTAASAAPARLIPFSCCPRPSNARNRVRCSGC